MSEVTRSITCKDCGTQLAEPPNDLEATPAPCPACGSTARLIQVGIRNEVTFKSKLGLKGRRTGSRKPFLEAVLGDDLFRKLGKWMKLERVIDRDNDHYIERVTDPTTGQVVHECDEPLSKHTGHGSARNGNAR